MNKNTVSSMSCWMLNMISLDGNAAPATGKFQGTCNYCNMKGHKEADCRKKIKDNKAAPAANANGKVTCTYCGKDGHKEADCYSKQNGKPRAAPARKSTAKKNDHKIKRGYCFAHLCTIMKNNDKWPKHLRGFKCSLGDQCFWWHGPTPSIEVALKRKPPMKDGKITLIKKYDNPKKGAPAR